MFRGQLCLKIVFHATGRLKLVNIVVGSILCAAFPLAYLFLKLGGSPESVFWAANITLVLSEIASIIILKKYIKYSVADYLMAVYVRCAVVTAISFALSYLLYNLFLGESFLRLISTGILTTLSVVLSSLYMGMNRSMRMKIYSIIAGKMKRI